MVSMEYEYIDWKENWFGSFNFQQYSCVEILSIEELALYKVVLQYLRGLALPQDPDYYSGGQRGFYICLNKYTTFNREKVNEKVDLFVLFCTFERQKGIN